MKRVIRVLKQSYGGALAEPFEKGQELAKVGQRVSRALEKEQRHVDVCEMLAN